MAADEQHLAAFRALLGRMGVVPILMELLRQAGPEVLRTLDEALRPGPVAAPLPVAAPAPSEPDRWLTTAQMAQHPRLRKSRSPSGLLKLRASPQGAGLRKLTRAPGPGQQRARLRWPERATLEWFAEHRPEEIDDGNGQ